ncbi:MAG: peptidoglycan-binding protein [Rhodobacteraceae bacterium]|nr:peptidoglycan-binding protein [Paracoccaceae bacterium]
MPRPPLPLFLLLLLLPVLSLAPGRAAARTAIAYSPPEGAYGWCAYTDGTDVDRCALRQCAQFGGTACEVVASCGEGDNAVALAQPPAAGIGVACAMGNPFTARAIALAACMRAVNANCWTDAVFDEIGRSQPAEAVWAGDRAFFATGLLQMRNFKVDDLTDSLDAQARAALAEFQSGVGLPATGEPDNDTLGRLFWAVSVGAFTRELGASFLDVHADDLRGRAWGHAERGNPPRMVGEEWLAMDETTRLKAVATYLASRGSACSLPARGAVTPFQDDPAFWSIDCAEGGYSLILDADGASTIISN